MNKYILYSYIAYVFTYFLSYLLIDTSVFGHVPPDVYIGLLILNFLIPLTGAVFAYIGKKGFHRVLAFCMNSFYMFYAPIILLSVSATPSL